MTLSETRQSAQVLVSTEENGEQRHTGNHYVKILQKLRRLACTDVWRLAVSCRGK